MPDESPSNAPPFPPADLRSARVPGPPVIRRTASAARSSASASRKGRWASRGRGVPVRPRRPGPAWRGRRGGEPSALPAPLIILTAGPPQTLDSPSPMCDTGLGGRLASRSERLNSDLEPQELEDWETSQCLTPEWSKPLGILGEAACHLTCSPPLTLPPPPQPPPHFWRAKLPSQVRYESGSSLTSYPVNFPKGTLTSAAPRRCRPGHHPRPPAAPTPACLPFERSPLCHPRFHSARGGGRGPSPSPAFHLKP